MTNQVHRGMIMIQTHTVRHGVGQTLDIRTLRESFSRYMCVERERVSGRERAVGVKSDCIANRNNNSNLRTPLQTIKTFGFPTVLLELVNSRATRTAGLTKW